MYIYVIETQSRYNSPVGHLCHQCRADLDVGPHVLQVLEVFVNDHLVIHSPCPVPMSTVGISYYITLKPTKYIIIPHMKILDSGWSRAMD